MGRPVLALDSVSNHFRCRRGVGRHTVRSSRRSRSATYSQGPFFLPYPISIANTWRDPCLQPTYSYTAGDLTDQARDPYHGAMIHVATLHPFSNQRRPAFGYVTAKLAFLSDRHPFPKRACPGDHTSGTMCKQLCRVPDSGGDVIYSETTLQYYHAPEGYVLG
jgi:hypothetical protein